MSDLELLQRYTRSNSQEAFATLVERHLNLVYSAARRQVRSPQLAEEVAQSVFIDLARHGAKLAPAQPLAAWLFLVTRRTAIDVIRREARRHAREQAAAELSAAMETPSPNWNQVKDVLDEALDSLADVDRTALLLRFFEDRSLREIGASLGTSDDTAQKRVSRALDRLRTALAQRGVAVSAASLATDLSAHAIEAAPAALSATISTALTSASALTTAPATIASGHTVASTAFQKTLAAAATLAVLGVAVFEAQAIVRQRHELTALTERSTTFRTALAQIHSEHDAATARLQSAREEHSHTLRSRIVADPELEAAAAAWLERVKRLKEIAATRADLRIAELTLLTDNEWFYAAKDAKLDDETQLRETFKNLHGAARKRFARTLHTALSRYVASHRGELPTDPQQLAAFLDPHGPAKLLRNYEVLRRGLLHDVPAGQWILAENPAAAQPHRNRVFVSAEQHGTSDLDAAAPSP